MIFTHFYERKLWRNNPAKWHALIVAGLLVLTFPHGALAQEAVPEPAQSSSPVETAPPAPAVGTEARAGNVQSGLGTDQVQVQPGVASQVEGLADENADSVEGDGGPTIPDVLTPGGDSSDQSATVTMPSFLDDPAGAISHIFTQAKRDPNLPHDLSPLGMFMAADWVVKAVMVGLAVASLGVWTVWVAKSVEIAFAKSRVRRANNIVSTSSTLADTPLTLSSRGGPAAYMVRSAKDELRRSAPALDHAGNEGAKERLGARLSRIEAQAVRRLSRGTGLLATVGSTAPFIGLFGTVWGIMNAFIGISQAQTTNLAVVAPGIAEALLATAMGLVAAIPAVIIYNVFARTIAGYGQLLADTASGVEQLVSLELDLRKMPANDPNSPAAAPLPAAAE